ncbi:VWA domain-containing protein [Lacinutrix sp. WUR7]|uniref:VWA domain-containing protein n=1 Tax=Lacinutrix sp. WUR7 TaxID=2653681 RepID=UPI00193C9094|nr:VWA domain-containing protein [Lacinutrix sp. WUR7]QRM90194.1 VWA domain-containing protein [Lacinutrix sp. WUR7]
MTTQTIFYIILAGIIALSLALFQYSLKKKNRTSKSVLFAFLRFISIFSLLLLLINPKFEKISYYTEKPNLVVAVDNSSSVTHLNQKENVLQLVASIKNNKELSEKFNLDFFTFGNYIETSDSLTFLDKQTNIDKAFSDFSQIYKNTTSPILLVTDGNQTYGSDYVFSAEKVKQPIFPVILGDTITYTDLKLQQLNVNKYAFLKNKFPVEAIVTYNGNNIVKSRFVVTSGNVTVYSENVSFSATNNSKILNFTLPANRVGVQAYKAQILPIESEKNTINNYKNFAVEVIDQKTNVAIISDFMHPDLGAFKKSIESNEQREVSIITPNKYLSQKDNFQLVILYQPNNRFKPIFESLKKSNANKFLILGTKTDYAFVNKMTSDFKLDITNQTEDYQASLNTNYNTFIVDDLDFESFPPLKSSFGNATFSIPVETILNKKVGSVETQNPLLVTFETSSRREAVLFGENIWKWRAQSYLNTKSFNNFDNFIGKLVQYLASNTRRSRLNVDYESFYQGNTNVIVKAQFFNKNYEFDVKETLKITVKNKTTLETNTFPLILKGNNYQVDLSNLPAGGYDFTVKATNENISKSGSFQILEYNIEQQFLNANVTKLQQVATYTNGSSYFIANTNTLINDLLKDERFATIQKSSKNVVPLIDFKYLLVLLILSLAIEWFLRKYNGLI